MIGWALRLLVIWGGAALVFYAVVGDRLSMLMHAPAPGTPKVLVAADPQTPGTHDQRTGNSAVYRADRQGHVILDGIVNGNQVRFLVDTGATVVALTLADAEAAGISRGDLDFNASTSTANGVSRAAPITLREIRVGQFSMYDVPAFVEERLPISLLGQSFLTRLESYEMRDGVLTLNWN